MEYSSPYPALPPTHMSRQQPLTVEYEIPSLVTSLDNQISRQNDLNLMGLQELDSQLSMFDTSNSRRNSSTMEILSSSALESSIYNSGQTSEQIRKNYYSTIQDISSGRGANRKSHHVRPAFHSKQSSDGTVHPWPESSRNSMTSYLSADLDDNLSTLSSISSKTTSLVDYEPKVNNDTESSSQKEKRYQRNNRRPKMSIPTDIAPSEYARQCIAAAESSRLSPYNLHPEEYKLLRGHITHQQVTHYLNIRNGILRLWTRNPMIGVTEDEALGCTRESRWFEVASLCYEWLVRRGYINFGCLELLDSGLQEEKRGLGRKRRLVAVIGAGMSGLGCARQLEGLFLQFEDKFREMGENPPRVLVVEGRNRIGGRVYSLGLSAKPKQPTLNHGSRHTVEMGGMIITGFDRGNPLNIIVRGQLALKYHALKPDTTIYDANGKPVDVNRDQRAEKLFNYILDRVSEYKFKIPVSTTINGDKSLLDAGRESNNEGYKTIRDIEDCMAGDLKIGLKERIPTKLPINTLVVSADKSTSESEPELETPSVHTAAFKAKEIGWQLKPGVDLAFDLDLENIVSSKDATLGSVFDEAIRQYSRIIELEPLDLRLINWHVANLEYSNATTCNKLSLGGWDLDAGNEWEGKHTMVTGGYQQVPRGLFKCPQMLTVRNNSKVKRIIYSPSANESSQSSATIELDDGDMIEADCIVSTVPLGVLKQQAIQFEPALPRWKMGAIQRIGYGVLNKIVLVYREAFWDQSRDIFGALRNPKNELSPDQADYFSQRGRFFQWFNVSNTTGLPTLLALMAGDAAFATEKSTDEELLLEAKNVLESIFGPAVPTPIESIVTRWGHDEYSRGSYSYTGPNFKPYDYEAMAQPIGNLFFAGEHTCGTHPATVHGAYISGLRAASEVLDFFIGQIKVTEPLISPRDSALKRKSNVVEIPKDPKQTRLEAYETEIADAIYKNLGDRPWRPSNNYANPYRLYSKNKWEEAKRMCEDGRRPGKGKAIPNEVKKMVAKLWKDASQDEKEPYKKQAELQRKEYASALAEYNIKVSQWDKDALAFRAIYEKEHPSIPGPEELDNLQQWDRRAKRIVSGYAEVTDSETENM
ncbi:hypothetical protein K3495_g8896 [Podosphaera aphanis]|nr:hypothetical protein K3495_g8896 [Podosphaera aphanis]